MIFRDAFGYLPLEDLWNRLRCLVRRHPPLCEHLRHNRNEHR